LRDPLRALEVVRDVCRGCVIVLDEIMFFHSLLSRAPWPVLALGATLAVVLLQRGGLQQSICWFPGYRHQPLPVLSSRARAKCLTSPLDNLKVHPGAGSFPGRSGRNLPDHV
jgi:hypothetical protein